jgi:hypothetical protein
MPPSSPSPVIGVPLIASGHDRADIGSGFYGDSDTGGCVRRDAFSAAATEGPAGSHSPDWVRGQWTTVVGSCWSSGGETVRCFYRRRPELQGGRNSRSGALNRSQYGKSEANACGDMRHWRAQGAPRGVETVDRECSRTTNRIGREGRRKTQTAKYVAMRSEVGGERTARLISLRRAFGSCGVGPSTRCPSGLRRLSRENAVPREEVGRIRPVRRPLVSPKSSPRPAPGSGVGFGSVALPDQLVSPPVIGLWVPPPPSMAPAGQSVYRLFARCSRAGCRSALRPPLSVVLLARLAGCMPRSSTGQLLPRPLPARNRLIPPLQFEIA